MAHPSDLPAFLLATGIVSRWHGSSSTTLLYELDPEETVVFSGNLRKAMLIGIAMTAISTPIIVFAVRRLLVAVNVLPLTGVEAKDLNARYIIAPPIKNDNGHGYVGTPPVAISAD
jgi:hypothetical protein